MRAVAVLIGVPAPAAFRFQERDFAFHPLAGVQADIHSLHTIITGAATPHGSIDIVTLLSPAETTAGCIKRTLIDTLGKLDEGGLFLLGLFGHGFQVHDLSGDEVADRFEDAFDEVFAASDGPILDDFFKSLWAEAPPGARIVAIADTCSSDTISMAGAADVLPVVVTGTAGPERLFLAASMSHGAALEEARAGATRGVLSRALEDTWVPSNPHSSYRAWFTEAALFVNMRSPQEPRLRYVGPTGSLLDDRPFQVQAE